MNNNTYSTQEALNIIAQGGVTGSTEAPSNSTSTGSIATQNLNATTGVATANSTVAIGTVGATELLIQVVGTYTGALSVQITSNGTTWVASAGTSIINYNTKVGSSTIASAAQGIFSVKINGAVQARVTALAAVTGTANITLIASSKSSNVAIDSALPTGTNSIGTVINGAGTALMGQVSNGAVTTAPGTSQTTLNSAANTNATNIKATAGNVYAIFAHNATASAKYVRFYNKATAPTVGTDVPVRVIALPANTSKEIALTVPLRFATGIGFAITGGATTLDSTAVAAGDVQLAIDWL